MNHEDAKEEDRTTQWSAISSEWSTHSPAQTAVLATVTRHARSGGNRSKRDRKAAMPLAIDVEHAALDDACRVTLRKLMAAGCTHANIPYSLEQFQVAEQDLQELKKHGFVHAEASSLLQPVLQSFERHKTSADVGKITVILNVNLA